MGARSWRSKRKFPISDIPPSSAESVAAGPSGAGKDPVCFRLLIHSFLRTPFLLNPAPGPPPPFVWRGAGPRHQKCTGPPPGWMDRAPVGPTPPPFLFCISLISGKEAPVFVPPPVPRKMPGRRPQKGKKGRTNDSPFPHNRLQKIVPPKIQRGPHKCPWLFCPEIGNSQGWVKWAEFFFFDPRPSEPCPPPPLFPPTVSPQVWACAPFVRMVTHGKDRAESTVRGKK